MQNNGSKNTLESKDEASSWKRRGERKMNGRKENKWNSLTWSHGTAKQANSSTESWSEVEAVLFYCKTRKNDR